MPHEWPLLGREAELRYVAEAIAGGRPGIVLVGSAGVGKTRLAREAVNRAEEGGSATAWVVATLARLWQASRGNVLFLRELLLAGQETNTLRYVGGVWTWTGPMVVSPRLREVLDARLGSLQPDQAALMEVLAYAESTSVSFLETLFSLSTLEAAERQGVVVVEKEGRRLAARLAHPLYGESVRARCPLLRARDIQRRVATALEATGARR